jgi:hypothetical protein
MKIENGQLILERKNCRSCRNGEVATKVDCPKCNGTGKGPRGGKNGCRTCHGSRVHWDWINTQTCPKCEGNYEGFESETPYDHIYIEKNDLPVKVIRDYVKRQMSFAEMYIGMGLFSCTDYGRHKNQNDEELIESAFHFDEKGTFWTQGIKLIRDNKDLRICDHLAIVVGDQGYSVLPVFEEDEK